MKKFTRPLILLGMCSLIVIVICIFSVIKLNGDTSKKDIVTNDVSATLGDNISNITLEKLSLQQEESIFKLCKVWGFLKYYHPEIAKGNFDWDQELFKVLPKVLNASDNKTIDNILLQWTNSLGQFEKETYIPDKKVRIHPTTQWIKNNDFISKELSAALSNIETAKRSGDNYYVNAKIIPIQFTNEKPYDNFDYKNDDGVKLIALFRYWNSMEYFYPYKNILDRSWDDVLKEFIPKIIESKDEISYKTTLCALSANIQDGHNATLDTNNVIPKIFGTNMAQIHTKFIDNKLVIIEKLSHLNKDANIKVGDIILKIDNKDVDDLLKEKLKYFGKTNKHSYHKTLLMSLLTTNDNSLTLKLERDGKIFQTKVNCQQYESPKNSKVAYETLNENIGYLYPGKLKPNEMTGILEKIKNTKGLIVDLRCYPAVPIMENLGFYLLKTQQPHIKFFAVNKKVPGEFSELINETAIVENPNYYKGKVVIIIDETTQSQAESTAMMFRMAPNAVTIGSNSTGANGDIAAVFLPGKAHSIFSSLGVLYPDGRETQRIGITPDIEVKATIEGIKNDRDELLEKAIELINK